MDGPVLVLILAAEPTKLPPLLDCRIAFYPTPLPMKPDCIAVDMLPLMLNESSFVWISSKASSSMSVILMLLPLYTIRSANALLPTPNLSLKLTYYDLNIE